MSRGARVSTVLFTDIVGSTAIASELGDARWGTLVERHHAVVRRNLRRFGGHEMDTAGDGFFAEFERPGDAIRCALASAREVQALGVDLRAGVHTGEVRTIAGKAGGVAVAVGARVASLGGAAEVLITSTTRDLAIGADLEVLDRGEHELKGVPGSWRVFEVERAGDLPDPIPLEPDVASGRRAAMEAAPPTNRRRAVVIGIVAAVLAVAVLVPLVALLPDGDGTPAAGGTTSPEGGVAPLDSVAAFDPESHDLSHAVTIPLVKHRGSWPRLITSGEGGIWVGDLGQVFRIDPEQDEFDERITTDGAFVSGLSASFRALWVGTYAHEIHRYNTGDGSDLPGVPIAGASAAPGGIVAVASMVAGERAVWVSMADGTLVRIDPTTLEPTDLGHIGEAAAAMTIGDGSVWIADDFLNAVHEVDAASGELVRTIPINIAADDIAFAGGKVWLLDTDGGTLTAVDAATGASSGANAFDAIDPVDLAAGLEDLWIADQTGEAILRLDPVNGGTIATIEVGEPVQSVTIDPETRLLWALVAAPLQAD